MKKFLQVFVIVVLALALVFTIFGYRNTASSASIAGIAPQSISVFPITIHPPRGTPTPPVGIPTPPVVVPMVGWNS